MTDERQPRNLREDLEILEGPAYAFNRKDSEDRGAYAIWALEGYYRKIMGDRFFELDTYLHEGLKRAALGYNTRGRGMSDAGILELVGNLTKTHTKILEEEMKLSEVYSYLKVSELEIPEKITALDENYGNKTLAEVENEDDKRLLTETQNACMRQKFAARDVPMSKRLEENRLESLVREEEK